MSNKNFSRRRRGMHFRPKGGLGQSPQKSDREASQARADVVSEQGGADRLFEKRHAHEIERAENLAAGLPPQGAPEKETPEPGRSKRNSASRISTRPPRSRRKNPLSRSQFKSSQRASWTPSRSRRQTSSSGSSASSARRKKSTRKSSSTPRRSKRAWR